MGNCYRDCGGDCTGLKCTGNDKNPACFPDNACPHSHHLLCGKGRLDLVDNFARVKRYYCLVGMKLVNMGKHYYDWGSCLCMLSITIACIRRNDRQRTNDVYDE